MEYNLNEKGELHDPAQLRTLCHALVVQLGMLLQHPATRMIFNPLEYMIMAAEVEAMHAMVCDAENEEEPETEKVEGKKLGRPSFLTDDDLADLFKNFQ